VKTESLPKSLTQTATTGKEIRNKLELQPLFGFLSLQVLGQFWGQLIFDFGAFPYSPVLKSDRCKPLAIQDLALFCIFVQVGAGSGRKVPKSNASANSAIPA
jgi:hypothetical protein